LAAKFQIQIPYNSVQFQLKRNMMQIGEQDIENMLVTSIVCEYGIKENNSQNTKKKKNTFPFHSKHISNQNLFW
jgi:hypothetical protein